MGRPTAPEHDPHEAEIVRLLLLTKGVKHLQHVHHHG